MTELLVARGKKVIRLDLLVDRPSDPELLQLLLGRSGKLRAPTIRTGTRLVVGFSTAALEAALLST